MAIGFAAFLEAGFAADFFAAGFASLFTGAAFLEAGFAAVFAAGFAAVVFFATGFAAGFATGFFTAVVFVAGFAADFAGAAFLTGAAGFFVVVAIRSSIGSTIMEGYESDAAFQQQTSSYSVFEYASLRLIAKMHHFHLGFVHNLIMVSSRASAPRHSG